MSPCALTSEKNRFSSLFHFDKRVWDNQIYDYSRYAIICTYMGIIRFCTDVLDILFPSFFVTFHPHLFKCRSHCCLQYFSCAEG